MHSVIIECNLAMMHKIGYTIGREPTMEAKTRKFIGE